MYAVLRAGFLSKNGIMFIFFAYDGKRSISSHQRDVLGTPLSDEGP